MNLRALIAAVLFLSLGSLQAQQIDVTHYRAELEFNLIQEIISGRVEISVRNPGTSPIIVLPLHLVNLNIIQAENEGLAVNWDMQEPNLFVELAEPLPPGDSTVVELQYSGHAVSEPGTSSWGGCFWNLFGVSFSMGVGFHADYVSTLRHWMPSHDIPSDKATFDVTFTVPESLVVASAGLLASVERDNGLASYRWVETHPTATYLFNYAISDYVRIQDSWQTIPMEYYVRREDSTKGTEFFNTVPEMMEAFTSRFGPYPFGKIGYCLTPIGAMEHQTMISYPQSSFNVYSHAGSTAAHELAHQWWGDWVTPADFRDAWLSEGFAVYGEMVYQEYLGGRGPYIDYVFNTGRNYKSNVATTEGIFPLYDFPREEPSSNYPQTIYEKGGVVMAMLREVMGEEPFFSGLRQYGQMYAYGNATTAQFQAVMEQQYGESLDWFFDEWVYDKGWPDYTFEVQKDEQEPLRILITQNQDPTEYPYFKMPIPCYAITRSLDTVRFMLMNDALETQEFELPALRSDSVLIVRFDPERLILSRQNSVTVDVQALPEEQGFFVQPGYPNPVHRGERTTVPVNITSAQQISISIYDSIGRTIAHVTSREYQPGKHRIAIPTDTLHAGQYWVQISTKQAAHIMGLSIQ